MEFMLVFFVCLVVMLALTGALLFGRAPVYRPKRADIYEMMQALQAGQLEHDRWSLFIGIPIVHDPDLETIRQRCYDLELEAEEGSGEVRFGIGRCRYNPAGMAQLQRIGERLKKLIDTSPIVRTF